MEDTQIEKEISILKQKPQLTRRERRRFRKLEKRQERLKQLKYRGLKRLIKITIILIIITAIVGGIGWYIAKQPKIPESEIISRGGLHWHPTITVIIKGEEQEIAKDIGIGAVHEAIHTHDSTGTIHMEMQGLITKDDTELGRFFKIWGKEFNSQCIFDNCNGQGGKVKMFVNGKENKEFENYLMKDKDKIEIRYE
ncbi:hypothetical protein HYW87_04015 [Candidatus Roizmanbacteria bacterium]|nr:hypothetical protein [Candidatus Roizmanbacteria bacterium]